MDVAPDVLQKWCQLMRANVLVEGRQRQTETERERQRERRTPRHSSNNLSILRKSEETSSEMALPSSIEGCTEEEERGGLLVSRGQTAHEGKQLREADSS